EVDQTDFPTARFEIRLEDQRAVAIAPLDAHLGFCRADQPAAMAAIAQQSREARVRIEARPAEPIYGGGARNERGRLAVSDQCVVLDPARLIMPDIGVHSVSCWRLICSSGFSRKRPSSRRARSAG